MAYQTTIIPMTLTNLRGHSLFQVLIFI